MTLTPGERAAIGRHVLEIGKILRWPAYDAYQVRLSFNDKQLSAVDYKIHDRISVDSPAVPAQT